MKKYSFNHRVVVEELDSLMHVNNVCYLEWVQLAAEKHWNVISNKLINKNFVWVVLRHEIDYHAPAKLNDDVTVTTWVLNVEGVKSDRLVEISCNGKLLAKAKTTWCLLNRNSMKPTRITPEIMEIFNLLIN